MTVVHVNQFYIDGEWSPGLCQRPQGHQQRFKLDIRGGYGVDMPFVFYTGRDITPFATELLLATPEQVERYEGVWIPRFRVPPRWGTAERSKADRAKGEVGQKGKGRVFWHPRIEPLGIVQVVVLGITGVTFDDHGVGHALMEFMPVWQKPRMAVVKPLPDAAASPLSPIKQEIQRKTQELSDLSKRNASDDAAGKVPR